MKLEVEQKFRIADADELRRRLTAVGVRFGEPFPLVDAYFNHPARDFGVTDEALRIRSSGDDNVVTYKGPKLDKTVKSRRELEQPLAAGREAAARFEELLLALSFQPTAKVVKRRATGALDWRGTHYEVAWDEVERLGTFVELELVCEADQLQWAKERILALQAELGLTEVEHRSYLEMVLAL